MPSQGSATAPIYDKTVRSAFNAGGGLRGARIDEITGARVFSAIVGAIFNHSNIIATMRTTVDGKQNITYRCYTYELDVQAGDFMWGSKALTFKEGFGISHKEEGQLDKGMATAFIYILDNEIIKEDV